MNFPQRICMLGLACLFMWVGVSSTAQTQTGNPPWPLIFDWTVSVEWPGSPLSYHTLPNGFHEFKEEITPVAAPSMYGPVKEDSRYAQLFADLHAQQRPMGILYFKQDSTVLPYIRDHFIQNGYKLDFVVMDFEPQFSPESIQSVLEAVQVIRSTPNTDINQAMIGNYDVFPVSSMDWLPFKGQGSPERIAETNDFYLSSGLNVALPSLYPYESYENHHSDPRWRTEHYQPWDIFQQFPSYTYENVAPNKRSALFWAPLEKLSNVKLNMPEGHLLIPFINDFVPDEGYEADPLPKQDNAALLQHVRLRGADGYYNFRTMSENEAQPYDNEDFKMDMVDAWTALDWLFNTDDPSTILNLTTSKSTGLQWSGVATDRGVAILVSNLGNETVWFDMPDITGYAEYDDLLIDGFNIAPGEHRMEYLMIPEPASGLLIGAVGVCLLTRRKSRRDSSVRITAVTDDRF